MEVTLTIPDNKIKAFKEGFLTSIPVPLDENNNPVMSDLEWLKEQTKRFWISQYKRGKKILWEQQKPQVDITKEDIT